MRCSTVDKDDIYIIKSGKNNGGVVGDSEAPGTSKAKAASCIDGSSPLEGNVSFTQNLQVK